MGRIKWLVIVENLQIAPSFMMGFAIGYAVHTSASAEQGCGLAEADTKENELHLFNSALKQRGNWVGTF